MKGNAEAVKENCMIKSGQSECFFGLSAFLS